LSTAAPAAGQRQGRGVLFGTEMCYLPHNCGIRETGVVQRHRAAVATYDIVVGVCSNPVARREGGWYIHHSFGTIVERLALHVRRVEYRGPVLPEASAAKADCPLSQPNIAVQPWETWHNSLHALKRPDRLVRHYWELAGASDALFIRGTYPLIWLLHWIAWLRGRRVVHWIAANSVQIMRGPSRGYGRLIARLGLGYAYSERYLTRLAAKVSGAYIVASGVELGQIYRSKRTVVCESSSTTAKDDFLVREDTCTGDAIRVLFLGFIRAEKGIEYLVRALPQIQSDRPVHLALVGGWDQFPAEHTRLVGLIAELGLTDRVHWEGYVKFGPALLEQLDRSDLLVLPSLSEGTPHVLIEARARSLPVIATRVGGIPGSITDGQDGLLVPPGDPVAIAGAISRIIQDSALRQRLIRQGRQRVEKLTIEWFVDLIVDLLTRPQSRT
jgi:glycosyltransferase involved in cell wall biosynthesis